MKLIATLFVLLFTFAAPCAAQFEVPPVGASDNTLPVAGSVLVDPSNRPASYPVDGFFDIFTEVTLDFAGTPGAKPPPPGGSLTQPMTGTAQFHLSLDGGTSFQIHSCPVTATVQTTSSGGSGDVRTFDTEMLALSLSGGTLPAGVRIRESPTLPSPGHTTLRESPSRPRRIGSFFDIFTELSIDDGQTWSPADGAIRLEMKVLRGFGGVTEPSPVPAGGYTNPAIGDPDFDLLRVRHGTTPVPPMPPVGSSATFSLGAMSSEVVVDGVVRIPGGLTAQCRAIATFSDGVTRTFDTEMLSLDLSGGTLPSGFMIRESPTKASVGRTTVRTNPGTPAEVSSFFDVFTELSIDGGQSWTPQTPLTLEFADTAASGPSPDLSCEPAATYPNDLYPPSAGSSTVRLNAQPSASVTIPLTSSNMRIRSLTAEPSGPPLPLPDLGLTQIYAMNEDIEMQISPDAGLPFQDVHASGPAQVQVTHSSDNGTTRTFDTEMLMLNLSSSAGFLIRESPTKQSLGKTTVAPNGGGHKIDSFFDIFIEVSLDGGSSWHPAAESIRLGQVLLPPGSMIPAANFPPPGLFRAPVECQELRFENGSVVRRPAFFDIFTEMALPAPGGNSTGDATAHVRLELSLDGGNSFFDVFTELSLATQTTSTNTTATTRYFDTEMLALSLMSASPAGGDTIRLRESPSRPSLGQIRLMQTPTEPAVSSFFDVFIEMSVDNGATWSEAVTPLRIELDSVRSGTVAGTKWHDMDGNGAVDGGESGLSGWKILLTDTLGTVLDSVLTGAAGEYAFADVPPGTYRLREEAQAGWIQTGGAPAYGFWMVPGDTLSGYDFGNFQAPALSGVKFNDHNGDGIRDPGDEGIPDWEICLFPKNILTPGTQLSGGTGTFSMRLNGLPPGEPVTGNCAILAGVAVPRFISVTKEAVKSAKLPHFENGDIPTEMLALELRANGILMDGSNSVVTIKTRPKGWDGTIKRAESGGSARMSFFDVFFDVDISPREAGSGQATGRRLHTPRTVVQSSIIGADPFAPGTRYTGGGVVLLDENDEPAGTLDSISFTIGDPASQLAPVCTMTDSAGVYTFSPLLPGVWNILEEQQPCWEQTTAAVPPIISTSGGAAVPPVDFGNHENTGTICVTKYYDINHNQQLDAGEPPMGNVEFILAGPLGSSNGVTDGNGALCFTGLAPGGYSLSETVPAGYAVSFPKSGVFNATIAACESLSTIWLNSAALTDTLFRTATAEEWARALDKKNKHKAEKCKPDKVDFKFNLRLPFDGARYQAQDGLTLKFNMALDTLVVYSDKSKTIQCGSLTTDAKRMVWHFDHMDCVMSGATGPVQFEGRGLKGTPIKVSYAWVVADSAPTGTMLTFKGTLPGKPYGPGDTLKQNTLRLPAPNLNNVGEEIYLQGGFPIVVGAPADSHSVTHVKYTDVQKSLYKDAKGILTLHTDSTRCLDRFITNQKTLLKQQKSLPPAKHDNAFFAEVLALKLNILASRLGKFPSGFDSLIYDDHKNVADPTHPAFNGKYVAEIVAQADIMLACKTDPKGALLTPYDYYRVIRRINGSFSGPVDTARWSCEKLILAGVRPLKSVPYLRAEPGQTIMPEAFIGGNGPVALAPSEFMLDQNYPNPFNPTTTIRFELASEALVTLKIYNMLGQEVAALLMSELVDEGETEVEFDASRLPSGVYIYKIVAQDVTDADEGLLGSTLTSMKKMLLIK